MTFPDLAPAADRMRTLIAGVADDQFEAPTPCPDYSLGDMIEHVGGLALGFTWAATKQFPDGSARVPSGDASRLEHGWRERIDRDLVTVADAWGQPSAWSGMTAAGGVDLPGRVAGVVALDELVVHGWDMARSSGQPYECDEPSLQVVYEFLKPLEEPDQAQMRANIFGPVVPVPEDAPLLDRVIGLAGRDPAWSQA